MTKPLYRRDIVVGKIAGLGMLFLILISVIMLIDVSSLMIAYQIGPISLAELLLKTVSYIIVLWLNCVLIAGITLLFGIVIKGLVEALVGVISFLYIGWYANLQFIPQIGLINPMGLFNTAIWGDNYQAYLFSNITFAGWLNSAMPFIAIMIVEILLVIIIDSLLINKEEL